MKTKDKHMDRKLSILVLACLTAVITVSAQTAVQETGCGVAKHSYCAPISPYEIEVCYAKTLHVIFPAAIVYVDLGSRDIIAGKADGAENVLRIKAANKDFRAQTNISVITENGDFFTFDVKYSESPAVSSIEMHRFIGNDGHYRPNAALDVRLRDLGDESPRQIYAVMNSIYACDERLINHIGDKGFGMRFLLRGLYSDNGVLYMHTYIRNGSSVRYDIDFVVFKIVDKKIAKRTAVQERVIEPLRVCNSVDTVEDGKSERSVYAFEMFTIPDDKRLVVELRERNGGRHMSFNVENDDIVRAKVIRNLKSE
jgi:conjugative transposon TraN protein